MLMTRTAACCCFLMSLAACSSDTDTAADEHVWEDQVEALDKAKEVEDMLKKAAAEQLENIQSQTE